MKKIILVAAMMLGFAVAASAQPRAVGIRIGNGGEVSYQHQLGRNFVEVDAGLEYEFGVGDFNVGVSGICNCRSRHWRKQLLYNRCSRYDRYRVLILVPSSDFV